MFVSDHTFKALADPTRRQIISLLADNEKSLGDIVAEFDMTRPAISKHLRILEKGHLISVRADGRERLHSLRPDGLKTISDWLAHYERFWDARLIELKDAVESYKKEG